MIVDLWLSASEIAERNLPGLPTTARGIAMRAKEEGWHNAVTASGQPLARRRKGRGGGMEFHVDALPSAAQARLKASMATADRGQACADRSGPADRTAAWDHFARQTEAVKAKARHRLGLLDQVDQLRRGGMTLNAAVIYVADHNGSVTARSLYRWLKDVEGVDHKDRLAYLVPRHGGGRSKVELTAELWDYLKADYLRPSQPSFTSCYERLQRIADSRGLPLPPARTLERRMGEEIPNPVMVLARKGPEALKRLFPPQKRDRSHLHALEAVNADGHTFDVFVDWGDGSKPGRPVMVAFQDLYSGKLLACRVDKSENRDVVRLALGDVVQNYGIPDRCYLDNGRAFASHWLTGGMAWRHRFKVKEEEPVGIMGQLGIEVRWVTPYHGQAKPIERAFKDLCDRVAKHPRFEGAHTGNSPTNKPSNYGSKAVPIAAFMDVLQQEITHHNARPKRQSMVCGGTLSFDQAFKASYEQAPIKGATPEQRRLWLLAAEGVSCSRYDGSIELLRNRYWSGFLSELTGQKVVVRFDPQDLHAGLHVYTGDGRYLGFAECLEAVGYEDAGQARETARAVKQFKRGVKMQAEAEIRLTAKDVADALPAPEDTRPLAPSVTRVSFNGNAALKPRPEPAADEDAELIRRVGGNVTVLAERKRQESF